MCGLPLSASSPVIQRALRLRFLSKGGKEAAREKCRRSTTGNDGSHHARLTTVSHDVTWLGPVGKGGAWAGGAHPPPPPQQPVLQLDIFLMLKNHGRQKKTITMASLLCASVGAAAVATAVLKGAGIANSTVGDQGSAAVVMAGALVGAAAAAAALTVFYSSSNVEAGADAPSKLAEALESLAVTKNLLAMERTGRTTAERLLRKDVQDRQAAQG